MVPGFQSSTKKIIIKKIERQVTLLRVAGASRIKQTTVRAALLCFLGPGTSEPREHRDPEAIRGEAAGGPIPRQAGLGLFLLFYLLGVVSNEMAPQDVWAWQPPGGYNIGGSTALGAALLQVGERERGRGRVVPKYVGTCTLVRRYLYLCT